MINQCQSIDHICHINGQYKSLYNNDYKKIFDDISGLWFLENISRLRRNI